MFVPFTVKDMICWVTQVTINEAGYHCLRRVWLNEAPWRAYYFNANIKLQGFKEASLVRA